MPFVKPFYRSTAYGDEKPTERIVEMIEAALKDAYESGLSLGQREGYAKAIKKLRSIDMQSLEEYAYLYEANKLANWLEKQESK